MPPATGRSWIQSCKTKSILWFFHWYFILNHRRAYIKVEKANIVPFELKWFLFLYKIIDITSSSSMIHSCIHLLTGMHLGPNISLNIISRVMVNLMRFSTAQCHMRTHTHLEAFWRLWRWVDPILYIAFARSANIDLRNFRIHSRIFVFSIYTTRSRFIKKIYYPTYVK